MNGKIIGGKQNPDQNQIIDLLKETLAQALEGNINSLGIIACMNDGYATVLAGRQASALYMGCGSLQRKILDAIESSSSGIEERAIQSKSSIIVPGRRQ